MIEITGKNKFVKFSNGDYIICQFKLDDGSYVNVKGCIPQTLNVNLKLTGEWEHSEKYGRSFKVVSYELLKVNDKSGVVSYLVSLKCGIGKTWATRIYEQFKNNIWHVLENEPEQLLQLSGFGKKRLQALKEKMSDTDNVRAVMALFSGKIEITRQKIQKIVDQFGDSAADVIAQNPYSLYKIKGLGFASVEKIARCFKHNPNDKQRICAGIFYTLDSFEVRGNACVPLKQVLSATHELLNKDYDKEVVSYHDCSNAINNMIAGNMLYIKSVKNENTVTEYVFLKKSYYAEKNIVDNIRRIMNAPHEKYDDVDKAIQEYDNLSKCKLADKQKDAIRMCLCNPISIITGGPGTGKTTVQMALLHIYNQLSSHRNGSSSIDAPLLLAPTGRAARRMSESTGYESHTIHSAIGFVPSDDEDNTGYTTIDSLDCSFLILDETSMADQYIMEKLFSIIPDFCRIVLIGDPDQLPSVGAGNVLHDMICSGVIPVTRLDIIFRQGENSPIIANAHKIIKGDKDIDFISKGFFLKETASAQELLVTACNFYNACVKKFGIDNVILLTPFRERTDISVKSFNKQLQHGLNPKKANEQTITVHDVEFRSGDRVMQMKNTSGPKNGDIGYIHEIVYAKSPKTESLETMCAIEFNNDGEIHYYDKDDLRNVDLAYASTIHKAQGSEYKTVIIITSMSHRITLRRNLIYTAVTRASENVAIIGERRAFEYAISNNYADKRYTCLADSLKNINLSNSTNGGKKESGKRWHQLSI